MQVGRGPIARALSPVGLVLTAEERPRLERELRAKAERRRCLNDLRRSIKRIGNRGHARHATIDREGLIQSDGSLTVEDIEPVTAETNFALFTNLDWIIKPQIKIHGRRRPSTAYALDAIGESRLSRGYHRHYCSAALNTHALVVAIDNVRYQHIERSA